MGARQRVRKATVVTVTLALALAALHRSATSPGDGGLLDRALMQTLAPLQAVLAGGAHGLGALAGRYLALVHVHRDNEVLARENHTLQTELLQARRAVAENDRLRRLLALREGSTAASLVARVIALDTSPYFRVARVRIDRGEGLVRRGMPVIAPEGLVGRIDRVAGTTSDVQLAVDPRSAIDVLLPRTGGRGVLVGKPGDDGYRCQIQYLGRGEEAREGDQITTSGLGDFPRDIPVGTVSRVKGNAAGLFQEVEVVPLVDFGRLAEVVVLVAPPPPPDPEASSRSAPSRGLAAYR